MEITPQCVVALTWTLKDTLGEELDVLDDPVEFLLGGNDLLPPIEAALQGHVAGAKLELVARFDPARLADALEAGVTLFQGVPALYAKLLDCIVRRVCRRRDDDLISKFTPSMPLDHMLHHRLPCEREHNFSRQPR